MGGDRYTDAVMVDEAQQRLAAKQFATKWASVKNEKQYAQSFWGEFFRQVVGVEDLMSAGVEFESPIRSVNTGRIQFIDVLWRGVVLIEHKSAGKSLDRAEAQARDYLLSLPLSSRAPFLIVSDFARIRVIDVWRSETVEFDLSDLPSHLHRFRVMFGGAGERATINEVVADRQAAKLMGQLYESFEQAGYTGHEVSVLLVRILFLVFGDDTGMWQKNLFTDVVKSTHIDGSGLGAKLQELFYVLDHEKRPPSTDPVLLKFPYVNGELFSSQDDLPFFNFTPSMRSALVQVCAYDWGNISPAIFGAMFQTVKSKEDRRELGEHYTSEANILKVIRPLFLDEYLERLRKSWDSPSQLRALRKNLGERNYLDPACGSGNFLIVTYRRLRELELKILARLQELEGTQGQVGLEIVNAGDAGVVVKLSQFHGIEYEEWSSQIATVAMFLADRQANLAMNEVFGASPNRFPLKVRANIVRGNALRVDWAEVCPMDDSTVIMGNPPFKGSTDLERHQQEDVALVMGKTPGRGVLDYVALWYVLAGRHIRGTKAVAAFVSTNSITQGQQPPVWWGMLYPLSIGIDFAHRTFRWRNAGGSEASVYVVIVGISWRDPSQPVPARKPKYSLWSYKTVNSDPVLVTVNNINAYLLDAPNVLVKSRTKPVQSDTQLIGSGNKPADGTWLSKISPEVASHIRETDEIAAKYLRRVVGSEEVIHDLERWGLWLLDASPSDLMNSPVLRERVDAVRALRLASKKPATIADADRAWEWQEVTRQPVTRYLAVPNVSSFDRDYTPMAFLEPEVLANNLISTITDASLSTFGVLSSRVFTLWNHAVSGRMKEDPRISNKITYNNLPFPEWTTVEARQRVEQAAVGVLEAREAGGGVNLNTLYNRTFMPTALRKAHKELDRAVLNAYGLKVNVSDVGVLELLFARYAALVN